MIPIIDTGHGYDTPGKRSIGHNVVHKGRKVALLKENSVNEAVGNKLSLMYYLNNKPVHFISNEWYDISLGERCRREHALHTPETFFMSIHADAFTKDGPSGGRFFYYGDRGYQIAMHMTSYLEGNGYDLPLREPMKANFKVLRSTKSPAVLFEMGFMTTMEPDLKALLSDEYRNKTAKLLYEASLDLNV